MNIDEIKFIDRLYRDLYSSNDVQKHTSSKDKYKSIKEYITLLENIHNGMIKHNHIDILKKMYHDKYVIKEEDIPDSYYKHEQQLALERGYGYVEYDEEEKEELNEIIINDQKKSLDKWLDYFLNKDSSYIPFWVKYWAFQGMLKLGSFDKEKGKYTKRNKHTVTKFAELNREALALSIDYLLKYLNKKEINDRELEKIVQTGAFQSIYTYMIDKVMNDSKNIVKRNEGRWVKYDKGSDAEPLVESLQGYNTGWCTAAFETADVQLQNGDFYVYYTKDENDEYKVPRIAIRMEYESIGEIRGIAEEQNLEPEMEEVVKEKIKYFLDKDEYYKKVNDMEMLTRIYKKNKNGEELTKEELRFLYEMDFEIEGFGYEKDPRIDEIIEQRNTKKDLSIALDLQENQIALCQHDLTEDTIYCHSSIHLSAKCDYPKKLPKIVNGSLTMRDFSQCSRCLELPDVVKNNLTIYGLENCNGLKLPNIVGGLLIWGLKKADGLKINKVLGSIVLDDLVTGAGLNLPKEMNKGLSLDGIEDSNGLILPEKMNGPLSLGSIKSIKGLKFPRGITKLHLYSMQEEKDIIFFYDIDGDIYLNSLEFCENLVLPRYVKGEVITPILSKVGKLVLPEFAKRVNLQSLKEFAEIVIPNPLAYQVIFDGHSFINYEDLKEYMDDFKKETNIDNNSESVSGTIKLDNKYANKVLTKKAND